MKHTIYLADNVEKRAEKWRADLNFSELLSEAIMSKISLLEHATKVDANAQKMLERFRQEEDDGYRNGYKEGLTNGTEWAEHAASLRDLRAIATAKSDSWDVLPIIESYDDYAPKPTYNAVERDDDFTAWSLGYVKGFRRGAEGAWDKVERHLKG